MKDLLDMVTSNSKKRICTEFENMPLAYAYVPYQTYKTTYNAGESLKHGTAFPELYKPMHVYGNEFFDEAEDCDYE